MAAKVLVTSRIHEDGLQFLTDCGYELLNPEGIRIEQVAERIAGCHAVMTRTEKIDARVLQAGKKLKVVAKHGVGVDCIDVRAATDLNIQVVNAPEANAISVSEHVLGLIVALAKNFIRCHNSMSAGKYHDRETIRSIELHDKLLGIIGFGRLGRLVAQKAIQGFGIRVMAYDPVIDSDSLAPEIQIVEDMHDLLRQADIITLHVPHNDQTEKMIGIEQFRLMRPDTLFLNTSRGSVVNEKDLVKALEENLIAGAALDVFEKEPPDPSDEILHLTNVILTPHNAALTQEAKRRMAMDAARGIHEVLSGKAPTWPVNTIEA